jgi:hypothetical protein
MKLTIFIIILVVIILAYAFYKHRENHNKKVAKLRKLRERCDQLYEEGYSWVDACKIGGVEFGFQEPDSEYKALINK